MRGADLQIHDCHQCDKTLSGSLVKIDGGLSVVSYPARQDPILDEETETQSIYMAFPRPPGRNGT